MRKTLVDPEKQFDLGSWTGLQKAFAAVVGGYAAARKLAFAVVRLDGAKNEQNPRDADMTVSDSRVRVLVIHAEERCEIARECHRFLAPRQS